MSQPVFEDRLLEKYMGSDEAVTVLRRIQISRTVVDAQFISATPKALELYGYDSLENFRHTWQSKTQALCDYKHTMALSICRHFGEDVPRHYVHTLVQPDGTEIAVVKRTREVVNRAEIYWITQLSEASSRETIPRLKQLDIPQNFDKYRSFGGFISVAEVEGLLAYYGLIHPSKIDSNRLDETIAYCAVFCLSTRPMVSNPSCEDLAPCSCDDSHWYRRQF